MPATAAQPKTTADRVYSRAPKGGAVSSVNGQFYRGGWFMPCVPALAVVTKPAPLTGSYAQVSWATGLRARKLAKIDAQLSDLIFGLSTIRPAYRPMYRPEIEALATERFRLLRTTSAVAIIDAR